MQSPHHRHTGPVFQRRAGCMVAASPPTPFPSSTVGLLPAQPAEGVVERSPVKTCRACMRLTQEKDSCWGEGSQPMVTPMLSLLQPPSRNGASSATEARNGGGVCTVSALPDAPGTACVVRAFDGLFTRFFLSVLQCFGALFGDMAHDRIGPFYPAVIMAHPGVGCPVLSPF